MPDIRYVCLSDMHLGAQNSLLTNLTPNNLSSDTSVASPVLEALVECLRVLIAKNENKEKPSLILAGDVLELALTTENLAAMAFERFIELILPASGEQLFKDIFYIPGNHDHHLWETAREMQYVTYLATPKQKPGEFLDIPYHTTSMFNASAVPSIFLNGIVRRYPHLQDLQIGTIYPNLALLSDDHRRCVIFTHGHFAESMYLLMSTMRKLMFPKAARPELTWDYEAENFAWIDFFWSTMGRSGAVGTDVEIVYDKLQNQTQLRLLVNNLASGLANRPGRAGWKNWVQAKLFKRVFNLVLFAAANAERTQTDDYLTDDAKRGLQAYLEGPVLKQIKIERNGNVPPNCAVIFGHTHKPFQTQMRFDGYEPGVNVYNTGGWVIDSEERHPLVGGAVVLVDENLNLTSLRMYNEQATAGEYAVKAETATLPVDGKNPFHERIVELLDPSNDPWKTFSDVTISEIPRRVENLKSKIAQW
jgi:UDP-2,3-diacylglucosamine pyrophosphatase LpxH